MSKFFPMHPKEIEAEVTSPENFNVFRDILTQLKIMNMHLSKVSGMCINENDMGEQ